MKRFIKLAVRVSLTPGHPLRWLGLPALRAVCLYWRLLLALGVDIERKYGVSGS